MTWDKLFDFLALNLKKFVIVLVSTGLLLFLPEKLLVKFNLLDLINEKRSMVSILFLISICGTFVELIDKLLKSIKNKMKIKSNRKKQIHLLKTLGEDEKDFLEKFIKDNLSTIYESYNSGTAKSLCTKRIIYYRAQTSSDYNMTIGYNIQPWAFELLCENENFLKRKNSN
ncbi:MAG: super-infection exclusion protein B [Acidaminobacteraceae bacterium]